MSSLSHRQRTAIAEAKVRVMAGCTRNVIGTGEDRIEEKQSAELDSRITFGGGQRIVCAQDHRWELAHQSASALTDSRGGVITNEVSLRGPKPERNKSGNRQSDQYNQNA